MPKVFISYRRTDTGYLASMLAGKLSEEFGPDSVFFDVDNIPLGVDFRRHLGDAVAGCDVLLALVGDQWLTTTDSNGERRLDNKNDFNRIEIEAALTRGIPVVPVLAGHATMPSETDLPESLRELAYRNAIELRSGGDLRLQLERMISGLKPLLKIESQKANIPSHTEPEPVRIKNPPKSDSKQNPKSVRVASSTAEPVKAQTPQREAQPQNLRLLYAIGALGLIAACLVTGSLFLGSKPNHNGDGLVENGSNTGGPENQIQAASESVDPRKATVVAHQTPNNSPGAELTTEEAFAEAEKLPQDDYQGVIKVLERALPGNPDDDKLLFSLAQLTTFLGSSDDSHPDFEKFLKAGKYLRHALLVSPEIATDSNQRAFAKRVFYNEACALSVDNQPEQAMKSLEEAIVFGYGDFTAIDQDQYLKSVRALPGYKEFKTRAEDTLRREKIKTLFEKNLKEIESGKKN